MKTMFRRGFPAAVLLCVLFLFCACSGSRPDIRDSDPDDLLPEYPVVFRQVYCTGNNNDTPFRYSFIELYNTGDRDISLSGQSLQYTKGQRKTFAVYPFPEGAVIPAGGSYLIRCGEAVDQDGSSYLSDCERVSLVRYDADFPSLALSPKHTTLLLCRDRTSVSVGHPAELFASGQVLAYVSAAADDAAYDLPLNLCGLNKHTAVRRTEDLSSWECVDYAALDCLSSAAYLPHCADGDCTEIPLSGVDVVFSRPAGRYDGSSLSVELSTLPGYDIVYTLDCSASVRQFQSYTAPVVIGATTANGQGATVHSLTQVFGAQFSPNSKDAPAAAVLRACVYDGQKYGPVTTHSYFLLPGMTFPDDLLMLNLTVPIQSFAGQYGIYNTAGNDLSLKKKKITGYLELFDPDGRSPEAHCVQIAMSGNGSLGRNQKSMRVYIREEATPADGDTLYYDLFRGDAAAADGTPITAFRSFLLRNSGNDCSRAHLRDALMQKLSKTLKTDYQAYRPVFVFINGEFWGLYNLRERYDADYFTAHYGIQKENFVMLEAVTPLVTGSYNTPYVVNDGVPGDEGDFQRIVDYLSSHDMKSEEDLAWVAERMDLDNFTDYYLANCFFANTDWPGNNIKVWRNRDPDDPSGMDTRWRWALSDMDFGVGLNTSPDQMMFSFSLNENTVCGKIMTRLLLNREFRVRFNDRALELCNTVWRPEIMIPVLDKMVRDLRPLMTFQFNRWRSDGGSLKLWENEILSTASFLEKRTGFFISQLSQATSLSNERIVVSPGHATVSVVCDSGETYSVSGEECSLFFRDSRNLTVTAVPDEGYTVTGIRVKVGPKETVSQDSSLSVTIIARTTITVETAPVS